MAQLTLLEDRTSPSCGLGKNAKAQKLLDKNNLPKI